jgi:hypothetical protein
VNRTLSVLASLVLLIPSTALPYQMYCKTEEFAKTKLRVSIEPEQYQAFDKFLEPSSEPLALGARYVGGAESDDGKTYSYLKLLDDKRGARIDIEITNTKPTMVFDVYVMSCNTRASLKPYLAAARKWIEQFGNVAIVEMRSEPRDRFGPLD